MVKNLFQRVAGEARPPVVRKFAAIEEMIIP